MQATVLGSKTSSKMIFMILSSFYLIYALKSRSSVWHSKHIDIYFCVVDIITMRNSITDIMAKKVPKTHFTLRFLQKWRKCDAEMIIIFIKISSYLVDCFSSYFIYCLSLFKYLFVLLSSILHRWLISKMSIIYLHDTYLSIYLAGNSYVLTQDNNTAAVRINL